MLSGWQKIHGDCILADRYTDDWETATGLGMLCGEPSGIICLDIDILSTDDELNPVLKELESKLPPLLLGRIGNPLKPPARFYKFNGEKNRKWKYINVELLSTGNQVLLPPSIHPDTGDRYKWADLRLSQVDIDDLPDLPDWIFEWLEAKNEEAKAKAKRLNGTNGSGNGYIKEDMASSPGRCNHQSHNHISSFAVAKFRAGTSKEELVKACLAYDKKINSDADFFYFNCPTRKEWRGSKDLTANARRFVAQIFSNSSLEGQHGIDRARALVVKDKDKENVDKPVEPGDNLNFRWTNDQGVEKPSGRFEDYVALFTFMYPTARKDYFSRTVFNKGKDGEWRPIENELRLIRAEARICGLIVTHVEDNLYKWFSSLKPKLLVDIPKWDGEDHIGELLSFLKVSNMSHAHFESLFKAWMAGVFKRVYHPEFHNQCLILKGKQGIGKDMLMGNIFKGLNGYYSEISMSSKQKDNYESIEPLMVSYLPEFDESSRIPISTIKAFISANKATFRGAYDRKASAHTFRHSVVSSANFDNILRDPTGNRRFWIFEIESIDWKYNDSIDSLQILAQAFNLYKDG